MGKDSLTVTDNRTGKSYEIPILYGTYPTYGACIKAMDLKQIKVSDDDFGLMTYDPSFGNTASCRSKIAFIDGERGILRYRGYPIEQLADKSTYLETAYLILNGELPTKSQLDTWTWEITHHTMIHESIKKFLGGFHYDAHAMGMLIGTVGALSTFYPDAKDIHNAASRQKQIFRLMGKMPTLAAFVYRHSRGLPYAYPDNNLSYHRQLPQQAVQDDGAQVPAQPGAGAGPGRALHSARRPRAELQRQRDARDRQLPSRPLLQELRPAGADHQEDRGRRLHGDWHQPAAGDRSGTGAHRAAGRVLRQAQALPERRLLLRDHLSGHGVPGGDVPGAVRHPADLGLAQWVELLLDSDQRISRPRQVYDGPDARDLVPMAMRKAGQAA